MDELEISEGNGIGEGEDVIFSVGEGKGVDGDGNEEWVVVGSVIGDGKAGSSMGKGTVLTGLGWEGDEFC